MTVGELLEHGTEDALYRAFADFADERAARHASLATEADVERIREIAYCQRLLADQLRRRRVPIEDRVAAIPDVELPPDTRTLEERVAAVPDVELPDDTRPRRPKRVAFVAVHPLAGGYGRQLVGILSTPAR
jgi:hypothetical protein